MNIHRLLVVILTLGWGVHALAPSSYGAEAYRGTVIDAETKAPLEGAVVVVIWYKKPLITMDGPQYFHKATEALTDAEGKFSVDASPGMNWNPFRRVLKDPEIYPAVVIYKPGYGPFPEAQVSPTSETEAKQAMLRDGAVVELRTLKTKNELRRFTGPASMVGVSIAPQDRIPNLMRLINVQRRSLGLEVYPGSFNGGQDP